MSAIPTVLDLIDQRTLDILEQRRDSTKLKRRGWLVRRALLAADLFGLTVAFVVSVAAVGVGASPTNHLGQAGEYALFILALPVWVVAAKLYGLYDKDEERADHSTADDFVRVFNLVTATSWLLFIAAHVTPIAKPSLSKVILFWAVAIVAIPLARVAFRNRCRQSVHYLQNTAIVGAGDVGQSLARKLLRHPEYGLNLVGFVDDQPKEPADDIAHLALLGDLDDLLGLVELLDLERVIFAFSNDDHRDVLDRIRALSELNVQVDIVPRFFEVVSAGMDVHSVEGVPVVGLPPFRLSSSSRFIKRAFDITGSAFGLLLLAPLFGLVAVLIKLDSRGPVFFRQIRAGADDVTFSIWKFRTMVADADDMKDSLRHLSIHVGGDTRMFKIEDDPRITRIGKMLRRLSIDEFPQLFNVLGGSMSLVGPRPLILEEHRYVEDWGRRRLSLKPGMTGLWQVLGRSEIPFAEMIQLDCQYVSTWSLGRDVSLLFRTLPVLVGGGVRVRGV